MGKCTDQISQVLKHQAAFAFVSVSSWEKFITNFWVLSKLVSSWMIFFPQASRDLMTAVVALLIPLKRIQPKTLSKTVRTDWKTFCGRRVRKSSRQHLRCPHSIHFTFYTDGVSSGEAAAIVIFSMLVGGVLLGLVVYAVYTHIQ